MVSMVLSCLPDAASSVEWRRIKPRRTEARIIPRMLCRSYLNTGYCLTVDQAGNEFGNSCKERLIEHWAEIDRVQRKD